MKPDPALKRRAKKQRPVNGAWADPSPVYRALLFSPVRVPSGRDRGRDGRMTICDTMHILPRAHFVLVTLPRPNDLSTTIGIASRVRHPA